VPEGAHMVQGAKIPERAAAPYFPRLWWKWCRTSVEISRARRERSIFRALCGRLLWTAPWP